jgi:hypothetical protein
MKTHTTWKPFQYFTRPKKWRHRCPAISVSASSVRDTQYLKERGRKTTVRVRVRPSLPFRQGTCEICHPSLHRGLSEPITSQSYTGIHNTTFCVCYRLKQQFSGSHGGLFSDCGLLGYDTVQSCSCITFRRNMLPTSSGPKGTGQVQATLRLPVCPRVEPLESLSVKSHGRFAHALWREDGSAFRQCLTC